VTVIRTIVLAVPFAYIYAVLIGMRLTGVWWGIVTGNVLGAFIAFTLGRHFVNKLKENEFTP